MNGVCGTTRLVGCYHLGPEIIPAPSTFSLPLTPGDDYIIIGTDSLWQHVSRETALQVVSQPHQTPGSAARTLRDLAVGCGSRNDVSIIVIRLTVGLGLGESAVHSEEFGSQEPEHHDESDEDIEFTNIDDLLSDTEDGVEPGQESTWNRVRMRNTAPGALSPVVANEDIDQMILRAVSSPPTSPFAPEMKSTNIDDILSSTPHPLPTASHTPHHPHKPPSAHTRNQRQSHAEQGDIGAGERKSGVKKMTRVNSPHSPPSNPGYPAQTIPRDAAGSRSKGGDSSPPIPPSQAIDYEQYRDSFEVTQSAPMIPANTPQLSSQGAETTPTAVGVAGGRGKGVIGRQRIVEEAGFGGSLQRDERGGRRDRHERGLRGNITKRDLEGGVAAEGTMEGYLAQLNRTMTDLDSDPGSWNGTETRPKAQNGTSIQRRLSYVESSYQQLTNNVYSEGALGGQQQDNELDHW